MQLDGWITITIAVIVLVSDFFIRVVAVAVIPHNRRPQTAMAWLLTIFFLPFLGILLFLTFGSRHLPKGRRAKQQEINSYILETTEGVEDVASDHPWLDPIVALNRTLGAMPLVGGNSAVLHSDYSNSLVAMTQAVTSAKNYVHVEFYIFALDASTGPFFGALEAAAKRGVTVRVLMDHVAGLRSVGYRRTIRSLKNMEKWGVHWALMLPVQPFKGKWQRPDLRNHRKILVVDGSTAFTGSQNIIDSSYNKNVNRRRGLHWKDLMVEFEGPIVAGINALFVTDWYTETDELLLRETTGGSRVRRKNPVDAQVVPSGPGFDGENNLRLFNSLLYAAQEKIIITSPYFVPDESVLSAITTAAQKGIDVQLFVSEVDDQFLVYHAQRSYYEVLLKAGVKIWLYEAPTVLHSKFFTIDDEVGVIGSSNMDMRSFSLNAEISVMVHGRQLLSDLAALQNEYRASSRALTLDEWMTRPLAGRILDNIARLTAAVQ
jgi:cardiolipin synthase